MIKKLFLVSVFLLLNLSASLSQIGNIRLSAGLVTTDILGDNIATKPFVQEVDGGYIFGGSFDQTQNGLRLEAVMPLDEEERFEIPFGFEYTFLTAKEKQPISKISDIRMSHTAGMAFLTLGLNYSVFKFDAYFAKAKVYVGLDGRAAYIFQGEYKEEWNYERLDTLDVISFKTKESALRLGANFNIGLNGELGDPVFIDFRAGIGAINFLGGDDERGELLTPKKKYLYIEDEESLVYTFNFSMMLQIKL